MFVRIRKRDNRDSVVGETKILKVSCISLFDGCGIVVDSKRIQEILCNTMGIEEPQPQSALELLNNKRKQDAWCPTYRIRLSFMNSSFANYCSILLRKRHRKNILKQKSKHKLLWTIGVYRGPDYKERGYETNVGSKEVI